MSQVDPPVGNASGGDGAEADAESDDGGCWFQGFHSAEVNDADRCHLQEAATATLTAHGVGRGGHHAASGSAWLATIENPLSVAVLLCLVTQTGLGLRPPVTVEWPETPEVTQVAVEAAEAVETVAVTATTGAVVAAVAAVATPATGN
eukprot:CAMPEP_0206627568 /NCGR_PEP_ID=MMETSP0325_2-20121206/66039_1 /ASSEMBLY_ACC=CAM_ASM_000347 /TAXON_ID=2866 /ORGANISM="Crypthecodinium cohnii, Strain Seligo" /LENGTH=147 /DNA_ID=CAMNT_0054152229 /DNA_START=55 /DNA_END=501 /DNA_ORIENTATION=-